VNRPGQTIFEASGGDTGRAIARDIAAIDEAERRYSETRDELDATLLLDAIENLRRFVLQRRALASGLAKPAPRGSTPWGKKICAMLHTLIGDVPSLVQSCMQNGTYRMERDTRRAIACLCFLGSLDPEFI
jgi:hypothetical protein